MKNLGEYIRELRDKKDLSLRELAEKIGCSAPFLSDIELGKRFPSDDMLARISGFLDIKKSELEKHDVRSDIQDFKKMSHTEPRYALAFRQVVEKRIDPEELLRVINNLKKSR